MSSAGLAGPVPWLSGQGSARIGQLSAVGGGSREQPYSVSGRTGVNKQHAKARESGGNKVKGDIDRAKVSTRIIIIRSR